METKAVTEKEIDRPRRAARRRVRTIFLGLSILGIVAGAGWGLRHLLTVTKLSEESFTFNVDDPARFAALELVKPADLNDWTLNGRPLPLPFANVKYERIPAIPATLLKKGENVLTCATPLLGASTPATAVEAPAGVELPLTCKSPALGVKLYGLNAGDRPLIALGPVVNFSGTNFFTVSCHTFFPVALRLESDGRSFDSPAETVHNFKIEGLKPGTAYSYTIGTKDVSTKPAGPYTTRTFTDGNDYVFGLAGDSRSHPEIWKKVAEGLKSVQPMYVVHSGDMSKDGSLYESWQKEMFEPAKDLLATTPMYPVLGNHEYNSAVFHRLFQTPGGRNWEQRIGPVQWIGIDGSLDWKEYSEYYAWLEDTLKKSADASFLFLVSHYAPYSSSTHGQLQFGKPKHTSMKYSQLTILPLLQKYHATAFIAGHDHYYERSETEGGVSVIVSAGGGAPLYDMVSEAKTQNPFAKVHVKTYHYAKFSVAEEQIEMTVYDLEGKQIDSRVWKPRSATAGGAP